MLAVSVYRISEHFPKAELYGLTSQVRRAAVSVVSNIAAPFLTVYLMRQLGYSLATVTALGVASQLANAFALYLWGRVSSRVSMQAG